MADSLASNRNLLPRNIRKPLQEAFSRQSPAERGAVRSKKDALERIQSVNQISLPDVALEAVRVFKDDGSLFWRHGIRTDNNLTFKNVLSDLYYGKQRNLTANNIRSAFHSLAVYKIIRILIERSKSSTFTNEVATHCAASILSEDCPAAKNQRIEDVIKDLKDDYARGDIYSRYACKRSYGFIFYMFIVPSSV